MILIFGEGEGCRVNAVPFAGGWRSVIEGVAQVGIATGTKDFSPVHPVTVVFFFSNIQIGDRFIIAGPACPGVEFSRCLKKVVAAPHATVYSRFFDSIEDTGERAFRSLFGGDFICLDYRKSEVPAISLWFHEDIHLRFLRQVHPYFQWPLILVRMLGSTGLFSPIALVLSLYSFALSY